MQLKVIASVLCLGTAACTIDGPACTGDYCGSLIVTQPEPASLFPPVSQSSNETYVFELLNLSLVAMGDEMSTIDESTFEPSLAESWGRIDDTTISFTLDPDARWEDGTPVTSRDVEYTYEVYTDSLVGSSERAALDRITGVETPSAREIVFRFDRVHPEQFYEAGMIMRILPAHVLDTIPGERLATSAAARAPLSHGPYRLHEWVPGQRIELRADTGFFLGRPGLRRIIFSFTSGSDASLNQLLAEEVDVLEAITSSAQLSAVETAAHLRLAQRPSNGYAYLAFSLVNPERRSQPHPLLRDRTLRRAIALSINPQPIIDRVLDSRAVLGRGPVSPMMPLWSDSLPTLINDTARANSMLTSLGWVDSDGDGIRERRGQRLSFSISFPSESRPRQDMALLLSDQLAAVGIEARPEGLELATLVERVQSGRFDSFLGSVGIGPSPGPIKDLWGSTGQRNFSNYRSLEFDRLIDQAAAEMNPDSSIATWRRAIAHLTADAPAVWLYSPDLTAAVHRRFENVTFAPRQWAEYLWRWSIPEENLIPRDLVDLE